MKNITKYILTCNATKPRGPDDNTMKDILKNWQNLYAGKTQYAKQEKPQL